MEPDGADCPHWWLLVRAVLDGRGAWRELRCWFCGAETVEPASGDRVSRSDLHGNG